DQVFVFSGTMTALTNDTITNPYDSATATLNGTYNINNSTYTGQGTGNTVLMTNSADFLTLDSALAGHTPNVQTLVDIDFRVVTGNGNDFVDLASANFTMAGVNIIGGSGNEIIWANAGDDTITSGGGTDIIDAGPGNDLINPTTNAH